MDGRVGRMRELDGWKSWKDERVGWMEELGG